MSVRLLMAARLKAESWPAPDVRELTLEPVHRTEFPPFVPGDHIQIQHKNGMRRDYSLIGPARCLSTYRIAIRRERGGRGGSILFQDDLAVGDMVFVSYPQGGMRIDPTAAHHVFVAGGIGITAVLGLLDGLPCGTSCEVRYCVRSRDNAPYLDELQRSGAKVVLHESSTGCRLDVPTFVNELPQSATLYYCGPPGLMAALADATAHLDPMRVRCESFTGVVNEPGERLGDAFDAWLVLSKRAIHVAEDESLLQAMLRENVPVDYSCEGGACGTCVVEVVDGEIEHQDLCLSEGERQGVMTSCVSRGRGAISLQA